MRPTSRKNDHLRSDDGRTHTYIHTWSNSTYRLGPVKRKKIYFLEEREKGKIFGEGKNIFGGSHESMYLVVLSHYRAIVVGTLHCAFH